MCLGYGVEKKFKKFGSEIRDKHPESATLPDTVPYPSMKDKISKMTFHVGKIIEKLVLQSFCTRHVRPRVSRLSVKAFFTFKGWVRQFSMESDVDHWMGVA
jgi:hypothetical protein